MGWNISPAHAAGLSPAHNIWAGSGPAQDGGPGPAQLFFIKIKNKKYFWNFTIFPCIFMSFWLISSSIFYVAKNAKSDIKISGFRQNFKNMKKIKKNVLLHTAMCLKAKKSYCVFHTPKNNVLACNFNFNNQFIKVKRTLDNFKNNKKKFCLSFSIQGTILHVICISDIKFIYFFQR